MPGTPAVVPGTSADVPGIDSDGPGLSVFPGPALVSVTLGPVGASVVLKNGPCVRDEGETLEIVTNVVFKDVCVIVVALAGIDVLKDRLVIAGFVVASVAVGPNLVVLPASNDFCEKNGVFVADEVSWEIEGMLVIVSVTIPGLLAVPVVVSLWAADEMLDGVTRETEILLPVLVGMVIVELIVSKGVLALELLVCIDVEALELPECDDMDSLELLL